MRAAALPAQHTAVEQRCRGCTAWIVVAAFSSACFAACTSFCNWAVPWLPLACFRRGAGLARWLPDGRHLLALTLRTAGTNTFGTTYYRMVLTPAQILHFKDEGFVILREFLPREDVDRWREDYWAHVRRGLPSLDPEDPSTWPPEAPGGISLPLSDHPKMKAVVKQLGAGSFGGGGGGMNIRWPPPPQTAAAQAAAVAEWKPPALGHVDGYGPGGWSGGFVLAATTYLQESEHAGGCFWFYPRSHKAVHKYFLQHPEQIDGSFYVRTGAS